MHERTVRAHTATGTVEGFTRDGVNRWRSIPYAQAPVGRLRFRAPLPAQPWSGVRHCHGFTNCAPQQRRYTLVGLSGYGGRYQPMSEDCLTLNVVTPEKPSEEPLPVMVFIHGGGYIMGSSATPIYDGAALARRGCVYVSVNYRLGVLGCVDLSSLSTPDVTIDSNLYLRDLVLALQWVRDNIAGFGGDPGNVTIFGESAGACITATLLAVPAAKGLFARAISESPASGLVRSKEIADEFAGRFAALLGVRGQGAAKALVQASAAQLVEAQHRLIEQGMEQRLGAFPIGPVIGDDCLPTDPVEAMRSGRAHRVPLIVGTNAEEGRLFTRFLRMLPTNQSMIEELLADTEPAARERITAAYPDYPASSACIQLGGDFAFSSAAWQIAEAHSGRAPTYLYRYDFAPRTLRWSGLGATHATELLAVFDVYRTRLGALLTAAADRRAALRVSNQVQRRWRSFSRSGVPGDDWPLYTLDDRAVMVIDHKSRVEFDPHADRRMAWLSFLPGTLTLMTPNTEQDDQVLERPEDLTASWLSDKIGAGAAGSVVAFAVERIGTGQMSECYRVALKYADAGSDGPRSVVLKVAATDPVSRQTGLALGLYEREVCFYRDIAPGIGGPIAPCYHAAVDTSTGVFDLLLGDAGPAVVGDEIAGATTEQARLGVLELGRLQGPLLGDTALAEASWLNRESPLNQAMITPLYAGFVDRYGEQIAPNHRFVCERLVGAFDGYVEAVAGQMRGLVHGDYRLDNMLFGTAGADRALTVVDWQTVSWGPALTDLAYFLGTALPAQDRREHYDALLLAYHEALGPGAPISLAEVREGVRRQSFFGVMMAIVSSMLVERTERGDQMFMTMLQRHCDHVLHTDALAALPVAAPGAAKPEPLQPSQEDELAHTATAESLWSESWYADFADTAQGLGGWFRIGLVANQQTAWVHALLCGPDLPTVAVVDGEVPLTADPWALRTDAFELNHSANAPLQTYRVDLRGRAQAYSDPSALLRGEPGTPVEMTMNLEWATDGTPYKYRLTTRYEIPCTVSGTVTVGDTSYHVNSVPGQRDHSWGVRDWWSMDWMWSAVHLDDGTHLHGVNIRIPGIPAVSVGYVQDRDGKLTELETVSSGEAFGDNGLPLSATLSLDPGEITGDVEMRGQAPVSLTAPDGRVSQFPRAWVSVTTADGRTGVGWMEWNRNLTDQT